VTATEAAPAVPAAWGPSEVPTTALLTDHYELTMVRAALRAGTANRRCVFELFARRLPEGRRYGVVAGVGRALRALRHFRFDEESLAFLRDRQVVDHAMADWLADYRFSGEIWGYPEGEIYFPGSPIVMVESTFGEAVVLETLLLSIYNHDSAIASAASRMTAVAGDRPIIEMGSRRTHELSAVAAARAAYIAGFSSTSNLEAGRRYGVPTRGTAAHAFTLLHATEREAFAAQIAELGEQTTLLVDTYDVFEAVKIGVELTEGRLGAVRLDSGDLGLLATEVRVLLDSLGATHTRIIVTSDLDEFAIAALSGAPVDSFGVGTALVTGSGHPTCEFVYKLVARTESDATGAPMVAVAKKSVNKVSVGGRKYALRRLSEEGTAEAEIVGIGVPPTADSNDRPLLVRLVEAGEIIGDESLETMRQRHRRSRSELPLDALKMSRGEPVIETIFAGTGKVAPNPYQTKPGAELRAAQSVGKAITGPTREL
jgi:nicotinate phosphoribosyltransferase